MAEVSGSGRGLQVNSAKGERYWKHEAEVRAQEIKILKQMVENAKTEINKREQSLAAVAERIPGLLQDPGISEESSKIIEELERKLSAKEYEDLRMRKELAELQAALVERNERIHDLCTQWERSTAELKTARDREVAKLVERVRHLEENELPGLRTRADVAESKEKQMRSELLIANSRVDQIETMARARLEEKERQLHEAHSRVRNLELDLEHVMAAAAKYTRREVLEKHSLYTAPRAPAAAPRLPPAGPMVVPRSPAVAASPLPANFQPEPAPAPGVRPPMPPPPGAARDRLATDRGTLSSFLYSPRGTRESSPNRDSPSGLTRNNPLLDDSPPRGSPRSQVTAQSTPPLYRSVI